MSVAAGDALPRGAFRSSTRRAEIRRMLAMALPLMGAQLLGMANGLVDSLVAGRLGPAELAAVGIGGSVIFLVTVSSIGLMASLSPLMSAARGAGRRPEVGTLFRQGLWMALVFGLADLALVQLCLATLPGWGMDAGLLPGLEIYLDAAKWSLPAAVFLLAARNVCEATARTRQVLLVQGVALGVNLVADLGLGLGLFGLPRLEVAGIGWSTTIVQWTAAITLFALLRRPTFERFRLWHPFAWPDGARLRAVLALSAPICLTVLSESALFGATAIGMGRLGTLPASAHNIAIGTTAFMYMLPLGLSFALTARVGAAVGRGSMASVRLRTRTGIALALALATTTSCVLAAFGSHIAALYTPDAEVQALAARFFVYAAVFQVSDAMQVTLIAALRGLRDTRVPMLLNLAAFWGIGAPIGYVAAYRTPLGPEGLWLGLIVGLTASALLQGMRLRWRLDRATQALHTMDNASR